MQTRTKITVKTTVDATADKAWKTWTEPAHIVKWNSPSDEWHTAKAENDLREGGRFVSRMEAKDGSMGFDFGGANDVVRKNEYIAYTLDDGRKVEVIFSRQGTQTVVTETFEAEDENPIEMQRQGWQAIIDNFKRHVESH